jgi:hypothetical protein
VFTGLLFNRRKFAFRYPVGQAPRTAILMPWFRDRVPAEVRVFAAGWCPQAAEFAPGSLAGTRTQLLALAGDQDPPALTHSLVVLQRAGETLLATADRERLWRAFHVPVFAQIVGERGELLAAECEAHDGLHIETPDLVWTGYTLETDLCACGRKTPRLAPVEQHERVRAAAVYAR